MYAPVGRPSPPAGTLERLIGFFSIVTMVATVPQVVSVWFGSSAAGVSLISWLAYLVGACLWFVHGIRKRDPSIWVACIGWISLDAAVVVGILVKQH